MSSSLAGQPFAARLSQFYLLTKPRVVPLIVFTAVIGMFLAVPFGALDTRFAATAFAATIGIALVAAAAINCLVESKIDALMARMCGRPLPRGQLTPRQTLVFAPIIGGRPRAALLRGQCADDVAYTRYLCRLRDHLHRGAEADDAAEHRDRQRFPRDADPRKMVKDITWLLKISGIG